MTAGWMADYAAQLWPLGPEMEALFSAWLPRLQAALGRASVARKRCSDGIPDGFEGLGRRGPWERLLTSEWALASEVPDEFLRRAATREQLFLELRRVEPSPSPEVRVWLDCGPDQLGAPRLAHLALLVVLKRRADVIGGTFEWAPLHEPEALREDFDPEAVIACRTHERVHPDLSGPGERYVIGPACKGAERIAVDEIADGLEVTMSRKSVVLSLPEPHQAARMLSRPLHRMRPGLITPSTGGRVTGLAFVESGATLLVACGETVRGYSVPQRIRVSANLRASVSPPKPECRLIGMGWTQRRPLALHVEDGRLFYTRSSVSEMECPVGFELPETVHGLCPIDRTRVVLVRDSRDILWMLDFGSGSADPLGSCLTRPARVHSTISWVGRSGQVERLYPAGNTPGPGPAGYGRTNYIGVEGTTRAVLHQLGGRSMVAFDTPDGWHVGPFGAWGRPAVGNFERIDCMEPIVGMLCRKHEFVPDAVVCHDEGQLWSVGLHGWLPFAQFDGIDRVSMGGHKGTVGAVATRDGNVHFLHESGSTRLSFVPRPG